MATFKEQLGHFVILEELGRGGMAIVYKAIDTNTNDEVALKILYDQWMNDEEIIKRFVREAEVISALNHENIVPIHEYGEIDGRLYLSLAYMDGGTLDDKFNVPRTVSYKVTLNLLKQVAQALDYAHTQGVIHRDLKLPNILLDQNNKVYLSDFGIARLMDSTRLTATGHIAGTPMYMSPEQARGELVGESTDIYAMGVMAYLMFTGYYPFTANDSIAVIHKHMYDAPPIPTIVNPDLPKAVNGILLRGLAKKTDERFATATDFVKALHHAVSNTSEPKVLHNTTLVQSQALNPIISAPPTLVQNKPKIQRPVESQTLVLSARRNQSFAIMGFIVALFATLIAIGALVSASRGNEALPTSAAAFLSTIDPTHVRLQFFAELTATAEFIASIPTATLTPSPTVTASATATLMPTLTPSATITNTPLPTETLQTTPIEYLFPESDAQVDNIDGAFLYVGASEEYETEGLLPYRSLLDLYGRDPLGYWVEAESRQGFDGWMRVEDLTLYVDVLTLPITWDEFEFLQLTQEATEPDPIYIQVTVVTEDDSGNNGGSDVIIVTAVPTDVPPDRDGFFGVVVNETSLLAGPGEGCEVIEADIPSGTEFEARRRLRFTDEWIYVRVSDLRKVGWLETADLDLAFDLDELPFVNIEDKSCINRANSASTSR